MLVSRPGALGGMVARQDHERVRTPLLYNDYNNNVIFIYVYYTANTGTATAMRRVAGRILVCVL